VKQKARILLIYTGGTIGMMKAAGSDILTPFPFSAILENIPELEHLNCTIDHTAFEQPIDSSDIEPWHWQKMGAIILAHYNSYDGFVVLHGSDTMAFSAAALSFMFQNLAKPIIFTGSQLPIGITRTDAKENLITSIEIAASRNENGSPCIPEVAIYFEYHLYRGNRTHKVNSEHFRAFESPNFRPLGEAGVHMKFNGNALPVLNTPLIYSDKFSSDVRVIKLYPGISPEGIEHTLNFGTVRGVVLETYGAGNASRSEAFLNVWRRAIERGIVVLNISQCTTGRVEQGKYSTSAAFKEMGVVSGTDMIFEAAVVKLMFLLGNFSEPKMIREMLEKSIVGELSP
jgi:L-asparaginase